MASDDDTLFRLIALGSDELQKQGYVRKGSENVVGPMPPMGTVVKNPDDYLESHRLDQVGESVSAAQSLGVDGAAHRLHLRSKALSHA